MSSGLKSAVDFPVTKVGLVFGQKKVFLNSKKLKCKAQKVYLLLKALEIIEIGSRGLS
jgi:hypothetical protein